MSGAPLDCACSTLVRPGLSRPPRSGGHGACLSEMRGSSPRTTMREVERDHRIQFSNSPCFVSQFRIAVPHRASSAVRARCGEPKQPTLRRPDGVGRRASPLPPFLPSHSEGSGAPSGAPCRVRAAARPWRGPDCEARDAPEGASRLPALHWRRFLSPGRASVGQYAAHRACPPLAGSLQADRYYPPGGAPGPPGLELARFQRERRTSLRLRTASRRRPSMSEDVIGI